MKSASGIFNEICKKKYTHYGFVQKKATFIRVENDIIQSFSLKRSRYIPSMTIEFGVCPLCHPQPMYFDVGPFELEHYVVRKDIFNGVWMYNRYDEASIYECIEKMMGAFDIYVIPFFEQSVDCSTALRALALLEERRIEVRAQERSIFGLCKPANELNRKLFDSRYYYLSLKAKDISFAKEFLFHNISIAKNDLKLCDFPPYDKMETRRIRVVERLQRYTEHLEQLERENWSYFEELLANNESAMLTELSKNYPKLFKQDRG